MESKSIPTPPTTAPPMEAELDISTIDLIDAIAARHNSNQRPPDSFTRKQFASRANLTRYESDRILSLEVESGALHTALVSRGSTGGLIRVYWEPE